MSFLFCCFRRGRSESEACDRRSSMVPSLRGSSFVNAATNLTRIFEELKCPICFNVCVPPIHNCANGHIVCNNCRQKGNVTSCPTCRESLMGARNYFAENFILNYAQQCRYASQGCEHLRLKGCSMKPHEEKCMFRPMKCIVASCGLEIPYKSLLAHLDCAHKASGSDKLPATVQFKYDPEKKSQKWLPFYIRAFGNTYYLMMQLSRANFWIWVYSQPSKESDDLEYNHYAYIKLKHPEKKISQSWHGPVHPIRTPFKTIRSERSCFILPQMAINNFTSRGVLNFSVDIRKSPRRTLKGMRLSGEDSETAVASSQPSEYTRPPSFYDGSLMAPATPIQEQVPILDVNGNVIVDNMLKPVMKQVQNRPPQRTRTSAIGILRNFRSTSLTPSLLYLPGEGAMTLSNDDEDLPDKNSIDKIPSRSRLDSNQNRLPSTKSCARI